MDGALVGAVLAALHRARRKADHAQLERVARVLAQPQHQEIVPVFALDASRHRLATTDRSSLLIGDARCGSLDVTLVVVPFAWWVLDSTLGESLRDAWRNSAAHHELVAIFERDLAVDAETFRANAGKELARLGSRAVITLVLAHAQNSYSLTLGVREVEDHGPLPFGYPRPPI